MVRLCQVWPLGKPQVSKSSCHLARQGKLIDIRNAVEPDRLGAEPLSNSQREVARRSAGCDDDIGPLSQENPQDAQCQPRQPKFIPACCIAHDMEAIVRNFASIVAVDGGEGKVRAVKCASDAHQLHPMAAAAGYGKDSWRGSHWRMS